MYRIVLALVAALLAGAPSAQAVIGGVPIDGASSPWFVPLKHCGSIVIAPDRLLTAAHCVAGRSLDRLGPAAGDARAVAFAMTRTWRVRNGQNHRDDVAIIQLDRPLPGGRAVELAATAPPEQLSVLGGGLVSPPSFGASPGDTGGWRRRLRQVAQLRVMPDDACARAYATARGNDGEAFVPRAMLCATDIDGLAPLASACNGDSGGPLYAERPGETPLVFGVVSWGGLTCGADLLPSVFAEVAAFRTFALSRAPTWAPAPTGPATITGRRRPGSLLRCAAAGRTGPATRTEVIWAGTGSLTVKRGRTYRVREFHRGESITCEIRLSGPGGMASAPYTRASSVRIPR